MNSILLAVAVLSGIGLLGAVILVLASHFMHVVEDERVGKVLECLPGANCGACGYAGCADYAKAIVEGAPVNKCCLLYTSGKGRRGQSERHAQGKAKG